MLKALLLVALINSSAKEISTFGDMVPAISALPDSIAKIALSPDLEPYVISASKDDRIYAAIRLGQISDEKSLEMLLDMYKNEKAPTSVSGTFPNVKYYILLAIGAIGGPKAEKFLMPLAQDYSATLLPLNSDRKPTPGYSDSAAIINGSFKGLAKIASSRATGFFDSLCGLNEGELFIRRMACRCYYRAQLKSDSFQSNTDSMSFLVGQFRPLAGETRWNENKQTRSEWIRAAEIRFLLINIGTSGVDYLDQYITNIPLNDPARSALESIRNEEKRRSVSKGLLE